MAFNTNQQIVAEYYQAAFNRAPDQEGFTFWTSKLDDGTYTPATLLNEFLNGDYAEVEALYPDTQTSSEKIEAFYVNVFDRASDTDGLAFWIEQLDATSETEVLAAMLAEAKNNTVDAATLQAKLDAAEATLDTTVVVPEPTEPEVPGDSFALTDGRDTVTGTDGNDTFYALAGQNQNGAIANAFATGDVIDGGAGSQDTLEASLVTDGTVADGATLSINGRTTNLEIAKFEVLDKDVEVDAGRMDSVKQFWSDNSDEDLVINDVRLGSKLSITKDITFGMKDVDQDAGLKAAFETQSLVNAADSKINSQVLIRVADVSTETNATPVANVDITIGFTLGATAYVLENVQSADGTYAGLKAAIEAALTAKGLTGLTVEFGASYTDVTAAGNTVNLPFTAQEILITDPEGKAFSGVTFEYKAIESIADQFLVVGNASAVDPTSTSSTIETNLILDNAGRGSTAGDVMIGGMSNSNEAIETMNLSVDRDSKIATLSSGYDMIDGGADTVVAFETIKVTSLDAKGDLTIGNILDTQKFDATSFVGENLTVTANAGNAHTNYTYNTGTSNDTLNVNYNNPTNLVDTGIAISTGAGKDVVTVNIADMTANDYSNSVKYGNFTISTGADNDTIKIKGNGDWTVDAGSGDDLIYSDNSGDKSVWTVNADNTAYNPGTAATYTIDLTGAAALITNPASVIIGGQSITLDTTAALNDTAIAGQLNNETVTIDGVTYDITTVGTNITLAAQTNAASNPIITVAINGTGATQPTVAVATPTQPGTAETLAVNTSDLDANGKGVDAILYEAKLTVAFAPKNGVTDAAAVALTNAFENTVTIATTNYIGNQVNINDAIKAAINDDAVLKTLLSVKDGPANSLIITSLIDGANVTNDLIISITPANYTALTTGNAALKTGLDNAYKLLNQDSTADLSAGTNFADEATQFNTNSTANHVVTGTNANTVNSSNNTFDLGTGDDILVLSTDASSTETIVFTGSDIGDNTVVHFVTAGADNLDFTSYLTSEVYVSGSTSTQSENLINISLNATAEVVGNDVKIINDFISVGTETFANLNASNLLAAIQNTNTGSADYAGITASTLDNAADTASLVGTTIKSILMIENAANDGEYKIFELTASDATNEFTDATLLGSVDFGAELTGFTLANLTAHA